MIFRNFTRIENVRASPGIKKTTQFVRKYEDVRVNTLIGAEIKRLKKWKLNMKASKLTSICNSPKRITQKKILNNRI